MKKYLPDDRCIVMSREEVRAFDDWAVKGLGVPAAVLMENAGRSCAEVIKGEFVDVEHPKMCIFCGTGNNGGDGYVIARHLWNAGFDVVVVVVGDKDKVSGDAKMNLALLEALGCPVRFLDPNGGDIAECVGALAGGAGMIVDAIFGTGLKGDLGDQYKKLIESINSQNCPILAVDIPSGLDCDTGKPLGAAIKATYTVTFAAMKRGFVAQPESALYTGEVFVASIGVEPLKWHLFLHKRADPC